MKKQYKIIPKNLDLPDEEVAAMADFDGVLRRSKVLATEQPVSEIKAGSGRNRWIGGGAATAFLATSAVILFFFFDQNTDHQSFTRKEKKEYLVEEKVEKNIEIKERRKNSNQ